MAIGQFYSRGWVKAFDLCPAMKGVAIGQVASVFLVATYYASILAITLNYFYNSFSLELPWGKCDPSWNVSCIPSTQIDNVISVNSTIKEMASSMSSSAEIYFE
jgi:solute carrier family 6 amino acid transporter-like protein 5/7/9/14